MFDPKAEAGGLDGFEAAPKLKPDAGGCVGWPNGANVVEDDEDAGVEVKPNADVGCGCGCGCCVDAPPNMDDGFC